MLSLLSPAKKLNFIDPAPFDAHSLPDFLGDSEELIDQAQHLSRSEISQLMHISDTLAELNYQRFHDFKPPFNLGNAKQAAYAFMGDTYVGLDAANLSEEDFTWAQERVRILSGLYGLLRPLDLIQAYRLEMGCRFKNSRGNNLYDFWGESLTLGINKILKTHQTKVVIACASNEYFKAVKPKLLDGDLITPIFKEIKGGQAKTLGMFAKRARGALTRFMIENRIENPEGLKDFQTGGYQFRTDMSKGNNWVFTRDHDAMKAA